MGNYTDPWGNLRKSTVQKNHGGYEHRQSCYPHPMKGSRHTESKFKCTDIIQFKKHLLKKGASLMKVE